MLVWVCLATGCAAVSNPVANGIPVRRLPADFFAGEVREDLQTIPLTLLAMPNADDHIIGPKDVLGVFIDGVLPMTAPNQPPADPPVYFPSQIDPVGIGLTPALGFPIEVERNGTLVLPLVDPISVDGMTIREAYAAIRKAYLDAGVLEEGTERIFLNVMQPRQSRVFVVRQELGGFSLGGRGGIAQSATKTGTGHIVDLRVNENDVLTALTKSGGLPGLDAFDNIYIFRKGQDSPELAARLQSLAPGECPTIAPGDMDVVQIPTRWPVCEPVPFCPEDVILNDGDVVFVEARFAELYYTGGLLPAGEQELPRDYDLDVLEAITSIRGSVLNGAFGGNNLTGTLVENGLGSPSPSLLTVIRKLPNGSQIPIRVDLNRALRDPRERILVRPGDILLLQQTPGEAVANFFSDIFDFNISGRIFNKNDLIGTAGVSGL